MSAQIKRINQAVDEVSKANEHLEQTVGESLKEAVVPFKGTHSEGLAAAILKVTREQMESHLQEIVRSTSDISTLTSAVAKQFEKLEGIKSFTADAGKPLMTGDKLRHFIESGGDTQKLEGKYTFSRREAAAYKAVRTRRMREQESPGGTKVTEKMADYIRESYGAGNKTLADVRKEVRKKHNVKLSVSTISLYAKAKRK